MSAVDLGCVDRTDEHCICWVRGEPCCRCGDDTDGTGYCEGVCAPEPIAGEQA